MTLHGFDDGTGPQDSVIPMRILVGDTTADGQVNVSDIGQTKSEAGRAVTSANFREGITVDGNISSADVALVKARSGTSLDGMLHRESSSSKGAATKTRPRFH